MKKLIIIPILLLWLAGFNQTANSVVKNVNASVNVAGATYGSDGSVTDVELLYINSLSSNAQTQFGQKINLTDSGLTSAGNYVTKKYFNDNVSTSLWADDGTRTYLIESSEPMELRKSGLGHGMTSIANTDAYVNFKISDASKGGLSISALAGESLGNDDVVLNFRAISVDDSPATYAMKFNIGKKTGTTWTGYSGSQKGYAFSNGGSNELFTISTDALFGFGTRADKPYHMLSIYDAAPNLCLTDVGVNINTSSMGEAQDTNAIWFDADDTTPLIGLSNDVGDQVTMEIDGSGNLVITPEGESIILANGTILNTGHADTFYITEDNVKITGNLFVTDNGKYKGAAHVHASGGSQTIDLQSVYYAVNGILGAGKLTGWTFTAGSNGSGNITTAGGGDTININDGAHGLINGDFVAIQSASHSGLAVVTRIDDDNFRVGITFAGNEAATWQEGDYLTQGIGASGEYECFLSGTISAGASSKEYHIHAVKNYTLLDISFHISTSGTRHQSSADADFIDSVTGDRYYIVIENQTDTENVDFEDFKLLLKKL